MDLRENYNGILELFKVQAPVGYSDEEIADAKDAVGELPSGLEDFYRFCGDSPELKGLQDEFVLPDKYPSFFNAPNNEYIVFFNENQGVCRAAVKKSDVLLADPPVYTSTANGWALSAPKLSDFLTAMFDYQASICLEYNPEEFFFISRQEKARIEKMFPKLGGFNCWLYDWSITVYGENGGRISLMEQEGEEDIQMNWAANNEEEFKRMSELLKDIGEPI
ncbi:MAG: hypothetical protein NC203_04050 [Firmicutes bacterium]|nr:hypothetical protein [[Eubacterium] siraeum]MCM1487521.1 hypothetical protein [Bacillota bacterium]